MEISDIVEDLLVEFEHLENMVELLEIGLGEYENGSHQFEASSLYVIWRYLGKIKKEYIEKLADLV